MYEEKIYSSAAIILWRQVDGRQEVYLGKRSENSSFFPGYYAFIGGTLEEEDENNSFGDPYRYCALRELYEETALLLYSEDSDQDHIPGCTSVSPSDEPSPSYSDVLREQKLEPPMAALAPAGRLLTPSFTLRRYDTRFFAVQLPSDQEVTQPHGELVDGNWFTPESALRKWRQFEIKITPPQLLYLRKMTDADLESTFNELRNLDTSGSDREPYIEIFPGIRFLPLKTETLPPADTINTYIVGEDSFVVIDPGTAKSDQQERLIENIDNRISNGHTFQSILLTHHHPDHTGAVNRLQSRYDIPVRAHSRTGKHLTNIDGDFTLDEGDRIDLGTWSPTGDDWFLEVLHTPGHTAGHLSFLDVRRGALITGDIIAGVGTVLITPEEGDMQVYLNTLNKLQNRDLSLLLPAHGPFDEHPQKRIQHYIDHRNRREEKVMKALDDTPQTIDELLPTVYNDVSEEFYAYARKSLESHLVKLEKEGKALKEPTDETKWSRTSPTPSN